MQTLKKLPQVLMTFAAVLALGFGASEAMAENAATACMFDPPAQLGECISEANCDLRCREQPGATDGTFGTCFGGECCSCFL